MCIVRSFVMRFTIFCMRLNNNVTENKCSEIQREFEFKDGDDPFEKTDEAADVMNEDGDDNEIRSTVEHQELVLEPAS